MAAPAPGWPTAAPPRAPTPAPFSRVLSGPPAHPAAKSVPARRNIEALLIHFMFMVVSILVFPFYLGLCFLRRVTARLFCALYFWFVLVVAQLHRTYFLNVSVYGTVDSYARAR